MFEERVFNGIKPEKMLSLSSLNVSSSNPSFNPEFLKWNNPPFFSSTFGIGHYHFLGLSRWQLEVGQPAV